MKTNLNNMWQKCTWQNLQQIYMQQMWDLFVKRRYFKFQNEIQFSSNSMMEQLKHRDSDSFCDRNMSCFYSKSCIIGLLLAWQVSLLMSRSRRNIIFTFFSLTLDGHDLKRRLIAEWSGLQQSIVDDTVDQWRKHLRYCVETSSCHFEHLL